ncbi:MAG: peptide ABC transporter substrate-binding protein [Neisseriaceae bacterium]|nr:MAG: peptide ABC transporter substrate-binding protein [Neisseriaceae bacterium]
MYHKKNVLILALIASCVSISACSDKTKSSENNSSSNSSGNNIINVDLGADIATLDPQMAEDVQSTRVAYDLFEGLVTADQSNKPILGLAEKWDISADNKTYTFHLRPSLKFSDGTPITADDVIFSFQRLADPKMASPYNLLTSNIVNGQAIIDGKAAVNTLGIKALDASTIQITLNHPDSAFLSICAQPELAIVSKANVTKFGTTWTDPKNMVTSGAYKLDERVIQGYILESKNPNYYDAKNVAIEQVKFFPIVDKNSSLSQYKSGGLDITYLLPIDQYKTIKAQMPEQEHTVSWETIEYLDFNMTSPKFKDNIKLRQALSMAVDRQAIVKDVMGQDQKPLYAYTTSTVEGGKFAGLDYEWSKWPRDLQVAKAQQLFKEAGYGPNHPLQVSISYNTRDDHKKKAIAIASMWQQVFGANSIQVTSANQEWKTFLQARHKGDYDLARDGWVADYDSVDSYTNLYMCNGPQNNSHSCTVGYNDLITKAQNSSDAKQRIELTRQALKAAMDNYVVIPLYQDTYYRLVSPKVKGYTPETNHLDHVMSKWYKF